MHSKSNIKQFKRTKQWSEQDVCSCSRSLIYMSKERWWCVPTSKTIQKTEFSQMFATRNLFRWEEQEKWVFVGRSCMKIFWVFVEIQKSLWKVLKARVKKLLTFSIPNCFKITEVTLLQKSSFTSLLENDNSSWKNRFEKLHFSGFTYDFISAHILFRNCPSRKMRIFNTFKIDGYADRN